MQLTISAMSDCNFSHVRDRRTMRKIPSWQLISTALMRRTNYEKLSRKLPTWVTSRLDENPIVGKFIYFDFFHGIRIFNSPLHITTEIYSNYETDNQIYERISLAYVSFKLEY